MKGIALTLAVGLLATPLVAFTPERAAMMVDAIRANGCAMTGDEAPAALEPLGLDAVEVQSFVDILFSSDLVTMSPDMGTLTLGEGLCAAQGEAATAMIVAAFDAVGIDLTPWTPDFDPARGADLVAIIRENDCAMSDEQAGEILPDRDFAPGITRDIVSLMIEYDLADVSPDGSAVVLSDALCGGDPAGDAAVLADALTRWAADNPPANESQPAGGSE